MKASWGRLRSLAVAALLAAATALPVRADISTIPLPEVLTDPNEGNTYGFLPVILLLDRQKKIEHIIAHDIRYNKITGFFPAFRLIGYPAPDQRYFVTLRKSQKIDEDYIGEYENDGFYDGKLNVLGNVTFFRDSRLRFYGFGNATADDDETNYTERRFSLRLRVGVRIAPEVELALLSRYADVSVGRGGVDDLEFAGDVFPDTTGLRGARIHGEGLSLAYDDRDSTTITTRGTLAAAHFEIVDRQLGSTASFVKYGFEMRKFVPIEERFVLAMHGVLDYMSGAHQAPFFERNSIGGKKSLRGFGENRFIDANRFFSTAELRTKAYEKPLFGVDTELELAPFIDVGQVFESANDLPFDDLHFVGGMGLRGVVRPQVVGFVDLGFGSDGPAVFTGLDYPF